jgi:hypothetical protein
VSVLPGARAASQRPDRVTVHQLEVRPRAGADVAPEVPLHDGPRGAAESKGGVSVGRPRLFPGHCRKLWLRFLDSQWEDLQTIKDDLDKPSVADVVRDAIDDYVADYRERRVFRATQRPGPENVKCHAKPIA